MKFRILLKDPDGIYDGLQNIPDEKLREQIGDQFFEWGDYCDVEIDDETMTGRVVPREEWRD